MKITDVPTFVGGKEGLKNLADMLDNLEDIPGVFKWDYLTVVEKDECGTSGCAYGWCHLMWPDKFPNVSGFADPEQIREILPGIRTAFTDPCYVDVFCHYFGIDWGAAHRIFADPDTYNCEWEEVTPQMVARAIRNYLL